MLGMLGVITVMGCATQQSDVSTDSPVVIQTAYICLQTKAPIKVDGELDEPAWQQAERITKFYPFSPKDAKNLSPTTGRLTWDKNNLYIAIECKDDDIWSYSNKADDELWRGDVAEFFIKPSTSALAYCEFVIAPSGALFDARYPARGAGGFHRFKDWSSKAKIATSIDGSDGDWKDTDVGYVVEMAIPFSAFSDITEKPVAGDTWTFVVCRYDYTKSYEQTLLMMSMPESKSNGYHYYEGYRSLTFR